MERIIPPEKLVTEVRIEKVDENEIDTILAEDIDFEGVLSFEKPLMIKGKFTGEIRASGDLYVGADAVVNAQIQAGMVSARGAIKGDIAATRRVELFSTARVQGDIVTPNLEIEGGCRFNGHCRMDSPQQREST
jgi:cytoskeletal protein CcmA (bactofilin family)